MGRIAGSGGDGSDHSTFNSCLHRLALRRKGSSRMKSTTSINTDEETPAILLSVEEDRPVATGPKPLDPRSSAMPQAAKINMPAQSVFVAPSAQRSVSGVPLAEEEPRISVRDLQA